MNHSARRADPQSKPHRSTAVHPLPSRTTTLPHLAPPTNIFVGRKDHKLHYLRPNDCKPQAPYLQFPTKSVPAPAPALLTPGRPTHPSLAHSLTHHPRAICRQVRGTTSTPGTAPPSHPHRAGTDEARLPASPRLTSSHPSTARLALPSPTHCASSGTPTSSPQTKPNQTLDAACCVGLRLPTESHVQLNPRSMQYMHACMS
jgi:hypothetical protein